jgi:uncharacterized protein YbgA (DUF1722 family)/uncharacterized protein YbbK (DUF523 family)
MGPPESNDREQGKDVAEWFEVKPTVVVSRCLGFAACRWNGDLLRDPFVERLRPYVDFVDFCPEVESGLGVPRRPVRLVRGAGNDEEDSSVRTLLVQPATGKDVTESMHAVIDRFLRELPTTPDGFLLKYRSPTCGPGNVRVYRSAEDSALAGKSAGMFAASMQEAYPAIAMEDEGRLKNYVLREHWLTRVFAMARLRRIAELGRMRHLVEFHARHKFLLMAMCESALRELGRIVADGGNRKFDDVMQAYTIRFQEGMSHPPETGPRVNALQHLFGYFSKKIESAERDYFLDLLEEFRREATPLCVPVAILKSWAKRFQEAYIAKQAFLQPYPAEVMPLGDSGKGRDLS